MSSPRQSNIRFNVTRELKKILRPKSKINSYFLYDANIEIALSNYDFHICSITNKKIILDFWNFILQEPEKLSNYVEFVFKKMSVNDLYNLQNTWWQQKSPYMISSLFFILNNCSDSGWVSCGKISIEKINVFLIKKLKFFKSNNFNVALPQHKELNPDFVLMPVGRYSLNLFEAGKNKGPEMYTFNHKEIHARVKDLDKKCILLYKNHPALFNLYKSFNIKMVDKYGRVADNKESCEDLIITNF